MKAIYLDGFSGISGNMLLGAFLEAGVPLEHLKLQLTKLPIGEEYMLAVAKVDKMGICASYVDVHLMEEHEHHEVHGHHHHHEHIDYAHAHRTWAEIHRMLQDTELSVRTKEYAIKIFDCLAEAEGKVHGKPKDEVMFHEVGATDSIVDIVGTAICLDYLEIEKVYASSLHLGNGYVDCAHGRMPVPAPAVAELLKNWDSYRGDVEKELVTPTGAAVVRALAEYSAGLPKGFQADCIAYGAGTWDISIPNVLRLYLGEVNEETSAKQYLLETNIDDMNPQIYGYVYDALLKAGALDVWTTAIYMKKNRPAQQLSVLVREAQKERCLEIIFSETTTLGVRILPVAERVEAARRVAKVETSFGEVNCKISAYHGKIVNISAEYDDCRSLALRGKVPLKQVQQEAIREIQNRLGY